MTFSPTGQRQNHGHCPSRDQLADYATGRLPDEVVEVLEGHVGSCFGCQTELEDFGDLADRLMLGIRKAATDHADCDHADCEDADCEDADFEDADFEDKELYDLARRAATVSLEATRDATGTAAPRQASAEVFQKTEKPDEDPRRLGQYRLAEKLGQGGMGTVYKALHPKLKREVAIKVLPAHRTGDSQAVERFHREMEAVGRLDHPNIVRAYDAGKANGRYFLVMELLEGVTLAERIRSSEPISVPEGCQAIRQAALGIQHAHDHGLIHRDIKPSNLMRLADGTVKVLDLGLAHFQLDLPAEEEPTAAAALETLAADGITHTGQTIGTLGYMSPEQVLGRPHNLDHRTDVYSLGVTLHELLTMRPTFSGSDGRQLLRQIIDEGPRPPSEVNEAIPAELDAIVLRAMARDPEDRYATAQQYADALEEFLRRRGSESPGPAGFVRRTLLGGRHLARRHRWASWTTAAVAFIAMVTLLWQGFSPWPVSLETGLLETEPARPQAGRQKTEPAAIAAGATRAEADDPPAGPWIDLLPDVDLKGDRIRGQWEQQGTAVAVAAASAGEGFVRIMLPVVVQGSYDLLVEFTRIRGKDSVVIGLPAGRRTGILHFSASAGQAGGLERIDDLPIRNPVNPTFKQSSLIENGRRYQVLAKVRTDGEEVSIDVLLDGQPYVCWLGKESSLTTGIGWWLPQQGRPALGSNEGEVVFHAAKLRVISGRVLPIGPGEIRKSKGCESAVRGLALSPDKRTLATCTVDGAVQVWSLDSGAELYRLDGGSGAVSRQYVEQVCFFADGRHLVSSGAGGIVRHCWNHTGSDVPWFNETAKVTHSVAVSSDGRFLAAGCDESTVRVWSLLEDEEVYSATDFSGEVHCVALSPLGGWLAAASAESSQVYLVRLDRRQRVSLPGHGAVVSSVIFSADGRQFASADRDGTIILWDIEEMKATHRLTASSLQGTLGHTDGVAGLAFSPHGRYLLSASSDDTIRLWDVQTGRQVHRFDCHGSPAGAVGFCSAFSTSGRYAVSGGADGSIRLWRLPKIVAETDRIPAPEEILVVVSGEDLPAGQWVNLLASLDLDEDRVRGDWRLSGDQLTAGNQEYSRLMLPVSLQGSYDLTAEFTRLSGSDTVCFMLPVGDRACRLCLSGWQGAIHGLETIDGRAVKDLSNPTARPLGSLVSGRRYHLSVAVRLDVLPGEGDDAHIRASLDGEPLLDWKGSRASLELPPDWSLLDPTRPGLGTLQSPTTFHSVLLRSVSALDKKASIVPRRGKYREEAPRGEWIDLIGRIQLDTDRFDRSRPADEFRQSEEGIVVDVSQSGGIAGTMLPVAVDGNYQLEVQFTRNEGSDMVAVLLPCSNSTGAPQGCALVLSEQGGKFSGIDRIGGREIARNPTCKRPGTLINGRRYTARANVRQEDNRVSIEILLDVLPGKMEPYIQWSGYRSSVGIRSALRLPDPKRPGLAVADNKVTFHSARFRLLSGAATLTSPAATTQDED